MASSLPKWQQISEPVSDIQLYPYLVRFAVIAIKQTDASNVKKQEESSNERQYLSSDLTAVSRLPRGTMKSLMSYYKQLALDKQPEPVDPALKRTYLAFYAQLLGMKSEQPKELEDVSQTAELLIAKFLASVSKISGPGSVAFQGAQFVSLLRNLARKNGGTTVLDSQLMAQQEKFQEKKTVTAKSPKKVVRTADTDNIAEQVARVMLVSPTLFERDLSQEMHVTLEGSATVIEQLEDALLAKHHPVYQFKDFESESAWAAFVSTETEQLKELKKQLLAGAAPYDQTQPAVPELIPNNVRAYFTLFLKRCLEADLKAPTLLSAKTQLLIKFVSQYWRITTRAYVSCMLHAVNDLLHSAAMKLPDVTDAYEYMQHLLTQDRGPWPLPDKLLSEDAVQTLNAYVLKQINSILKSLFSPKPAKLGPFLQVIVVVIPSVTEYWGGTVAVSPAQIRQLRRTIIETAEHEYVRLVSLLPRDSSLDVQHIVDFVQSIIQIAQKLQNKYRIPMFDEISIAKVVCAHHLKLLFSDFTPIWDFCMKQYQLKEEEPPFDLMVTLHDDLTILLDLHSQMNMGDGSSTLDPESLLFPYFRNWAVESAKLSREWIKPVLEQDTNQPIDVNSGKMHSTAVKDLFSSFYSAIALVEKQHWHNQYYTARLLTIIVEGISAAICDWAAHLFARFLLEIKPASIKIRPRIKPKENDEQWLAYAKEATAQATAAVMSSSRQNHQPESFGFKRESGVKINNIAAAYDMLHQMESRLNSDDISKKIQAQERKSSARGMSYLFTLTIISANDVKQTDNGLYVTLVDQDTRKQLGKTSTSYGDSRKPTWNEPIELEVSMNRPKLLKATLWSESQHSDHELCGRAMIRLDPSQFARKEYGTQLKWIDLESGSGKLQVMLAVDLLQDDIRFHFGKALRFLKRTRDTMVNSVVKQFSDYIYMILSRQMLREFAGPGGIATSVQSGVNQLQKSFNMWLGKTNNPAIEKQRQEPGEERAADDCLQPLYDYLNKNFATLAGILTPELRIEVLSGTWDVVLEALELLIIPPLDYRRTSQTQLSSTEMEAVYAWLSSLRDFFYSDGAGPSLERLQSQSYQQIMAIPVYYDLPTPQLKVECEKVVKASLRALAGSQELMARQRTVMAHRNKSIIEYQATQIHNAQRMLPQLDDVILRILRLRGEYAFIEQHLKFRQRLLQREMTERALQGSIF